MPQQRYYKYEFFTDSEYGRKAIIEEANEEANKVVNSDYPYAIFREYQDIMRAGESIFQTWQKNKWTGADSLIINRWERQEEERKRLFVSTFIDRYQEAIAEKDSKAGSQPSYTPKPITVQGATASLKIVERNPDEDLYIIELVDPNHLDEPQLVYVHVSNEPQQAISSGQAFATSHSDTTTVLPSQQSYERTGTGKVQHVYLKRKR